MPHLPTRLAGISALLLASACAEPPRPLETVDLVIENVTVIDAVNGVRDAQTLRIADGRIVSIGPTLTREAGRGIVDGTGKFLIPGLWDFHVHLTYDERFTEAMPALFLSWGVTSIRDTGGTLDAVKPVVDGIRADSLPAPRVFYAGPLLDGAAAVYDGVSRPALGIASASPGEARAHVAALDSAGVDFVKIYEMVTPEMFDAIVDEARARGLPIDGHVPLSMLARDVGPRVNSLEHLRNLELDCATDAESLLAERRSRLGRLGDGPAADLRSELHRLQRLPAIAAVDRARCDELLDALSETIQVPTLRLNALALVHPSERSDWEEALTRVPAEVAEAWGASTPTGGDDTFARWSLDLVGRMDDAGVPIGAGTDTPIGLAIPGYSLHSELELLVRAGLDPLDALAAATVQPAAFFGLEGEMGTIEPGRVADLVLLDANPLEHIASTREIRAVVTRGEFIAVEELVAAARGASGLGAGGVR